MKFFLKKSVLKILKKSVFLSIVTFSVFTITFLSSCASEPEIQLVQEPIDETLNIPEGHIYFKDFAGIHSFKPIQNAKPHPYDLTKFTKKGEKVFYNDEKYESVLGIDVSRHVGRINWKKVKKAGYDFVIIRLGWRGYETGILHVDERFHKNIKGAQKAGLEVGVYVFSQALNEEEALEEALLAIEELKKYKITMPVVFDPEDIYPGPARTDDVTGEQFTKNTLLFLETVKEAGYTPMIYSNLNWQGFVLDIMQLQDYKMWYADYKPLPRTPYNFEFWQYTSKGKVPGVHYECDIDLWIREKTQETVINDPVFTEEQENNAETPSEVLPKEEFEGTDDADISSETNYLEYGEQKNGESNE